MSEKQIKAPSFPRFLAGTVIYLLAALVGAWCLGFFDTDGQPLDPNEWGDVLSGLSSPLAFLWLLYASLLQRSELALQRKEFNDNNKTQAEQKDAMEKQVKALMAQAKLLEAQADATYEPIFVVHSVDGKFEQDSFVLITLKNLGGGITNVRAGPNALPSLVWLRPEGVPDKASDVIPYWPTDGKVRFSVDLSDPDAADKMMSLTFNRLDNTRKTNEYLLRDKGYRLELCASAVKATLGSTISVHSRIEG